MLSVMHKGIFKLTNALVFKVSMVGSLVCGQDQLPVATSQVYDAVANLWKAWLDEDALSTLRKGMRETSSASFPTLLCEFSSSAFSGPGVCQAPLHLFSWRSVSSDIILRSVS